jgi:Na+/H+ antiporter NhaD/arsenite permease-like protein
MRRRVIAIACVLAVVVLAWWASPPGRAQSPAAQTATLLISGRVLNTQNNPIPDATLQPILDGQPVEVVAVDGATDWPTDQSRMDGSFLLALPLSPQTVQALRNGQSHLVLRVHRPTFANKSLSISPPAYGQGVDANGTPHSLVFLGNITLARQPNPAFFIATGTFLVVFGLISFRVIHETVAALLGAVSIMGITYGLGTFNDAFWIISFERAVESIDFNVIFLIMGMMIFMAVMGQTGVFQWLAFRAYKMTRGKTWLLAIALTGLTGLISAFLNDVTAILLMVPISIEIALTIQVHPFAFVIPEVLASNIGGAATLIGDPPSTVVGSHLGLGFAEYLVNMAPLALLTMLVLFGAISLIYRTQYFRTSFRPSSELLERLEAEARITDAPLLRRTLVLMAITLVLFFTEGLMNMPPSVVALIGATLLLVWVKPDIEHMVSQVDWTTLVFFMALFILVGGVEEVGLIQMVAGAIGHLAAGNLTLALLLMVWITGIASAIVANIPFTIAALPVADFLSRTIPGAGNRVLYWALIVGADFGGNATYLGSAPNIVAIGLCDRAGYRMTFFDFLRVGALITFVTLLIASAWLYLMY